MTGPLTFNPEDHTYYVDGARIPNVTGVLDLFATNYAGIPPEIMEKAKVRGTAVHRATEYDDKGILQYEVLSPELRPYVDAWRKFRAQTGFKPTLVEAKVYSPLRQYAGTLDRVGMLAGREVLLDIKSGSAMRPTTGPQTAAYELALRTDPEYPDRDIDVKLPRYGCELHKDGTYSLKRFDDPGDLSVFLAALTLLGWKQKHG